ncbi:MAG: hypothetical protein FWD40_11255 [Treponema sp.]|nr:hypothetical protein [Treponema sp.]
MKHIYIFIAVILLLSACATSNKKDADEFIVNMNSPQIPIGEIELQFESFMGIGGLRKSTAAVLYFPREDAVCLQYRQDYTTYHQFWDRSGRQAFLSALQQYNKDFDERNLNRTQRRSLRNYGTVKGFLVWQQFAFAVQARGNMDVELGFAFRERAPYFTINQRVAEYNETISESDIKTSIIVTMFYTRAQAAELAALFEQHFLNDLNVNIAPVNLIVGRDDY